MLIEATVSRTRSGVLSAWFAIIGCCIGCRFETSPLFNASNPSQTAAAFDGASSTALAGSWSSGHAGQGAAGRAGQTPPTTAQAGSSAAGNAALASHGNAGGPVDHLSNTNLIDASVGTLVMDASAADAGMSTTVTTMNPTPVNADADDAGDTVTDGGHAVQPAPAPGSIFTACRATSECLTGLICTLDASYTAGMGRGYCTATCDAFGVLAPCPQPTSGMVRADCSGSLCILGTCERAACPNQMMCQQTTTTTIVTGQVNNVFVCKPL